ncbi:MAG: hypothetical protein ABI688_07880 [Bacteroidota bacterium]
MKKISRWARDHKTPTRIIIVISFLLLTVLGIATGNLLKDMDIAVASAAMFICVAVYVVSALAYPAKSLKGRKLNAAAFYTRQKTCDFLLAASTFCMIVFLSNRPDQLFNYSTPLGAAIPASAAVPKDSTLKSYKTIAAFSASLKDETGKSLKWKEKKKLLKEQISAIKKDGEMSNGGKTGLIILSVLVAIGLLALVASLACNLSCNGSEGAATLVLIGGTALIVFLLVVAIKSITRKNKKAKKTETDPGDPPKTDKKE